MPTSKITIAVDGYAACGKSTLAKALAQTLHYRYIDTGAMYRAVTLYFIEQEIDHEELEAVEVALAQIKIDFKPVNGQNHTFLNGKDVEAEIRTMEVSELVSPVSTISKVRRFLVSRQQEMGQEKGIVMDGRDIGTVVFPNAELKLFVTASIAERTRRRLKELQDKGHEDLDAQTVENNLKKRDHIDSSRADSPLKKADDAVTIDNTNMSQEEQLRVALRLAEKQIQKKMQIKQV